MKRLRRGDNAGFTLVEVMIAMVIFGIAAAATTPLLIKALDATRTGKLNTQAKNLLQLRIESMRNLPFHVATSAGPYIDLLDTYFRDATGTDTNTACDTHAYTAATSTYTCSRTHLALPGFTEQVDSQFVDQNNAVVVPLSGYDSQSSTADVPASNTLSVTITVSWTGRGATKSFSTSTQISSSDTTLPQIVARIRDSAVSINTTTDDTAAPDKLQFDAGLINGAVGLSTGATANAEVQGALATLSSGATSASQAAGYLDAPPDQTTFSTQPGTASTGGPCASLFNCFGPTAVSNVTGAASQGLPQVGTAPSPVTAALSKSGAVGDRGYWVSNVPTGVTQPPLVRLGVQQATAPPTTAAPTQLVRSVQGSSNTGYVASCTGPGSATGSADFVTSTGYVATTGGSSHSVTTCATATARRLDIFPLAAASGFNANGVVQIELQYAAVQCAAVAGAAGQATVTYHGTVSFLPYLASSPTVLTFDSGQTTDPLTSAMLTKSATTGGVQIGVDSTNNPIWLGDYIKSWSSGAVSQSQVSQSAQVDLKALVISTVPTRDPAVDTSGASSINVVAGLLSCSSQDNR